jgi:hypothetical protein
MAESNDIVDKSGWMEGPWLLEPDRVEWEHAGFPCLILRHDKMGHLCGYIAVPKGHIWHGLPDDSQPRPEGSPEPEIHGGVTYGNACDGDVCHKPKPGESEDVWWIGFDAAHAGDFSPGAGFGSAASYKDVKYMTRQCEHLAEQAAKAVKA